MATRRPNIYGGFPARYGLPAVRAALRSLFREDELRIQSDPDGRETLIVQTRSAFFHTLHMEEEGNYLFDGGVEGPLDQVIAFAKAISNALDHAQIEHNLHVVDGPMSYVASFPEWRFPREAEG